MESVQDKHIAGCALNIIKSVLALHSDPAQSSETDKNIQHELYHLDKLVKQQFRAVMPNTILGLGRSLGFFAHLAAGGDIPDNPLLGFTSGPKSKSGIVFALAKSLGEGQIDVEAKLHEIEKELDLALTIFQGIPQWDSLRPGVPVQQSVREILNDYHRGYIS
jgi:hypothetical protein